jgi:sec-independent protein translocase protein TatB
MFGMGFTEILIILIIAILFLGPDKLPGAMVDIAKFFKNTKNAIGSMKESFEHEMEASGIKAEALAYKQELLNAQEQLSKVNDIPGTINSSVSTLVQDMFNETPQEPEVKKAPKEEQEVTFKKRENIDV